MLHPLMLHASTRAFHPARCFANPFCRYLFKDTGASSASLLRARRRRRSDQPVVHPSGASPKRIFLPLRGNCNHSKSYLTRRSLSGLQARCSSRSVLIHGESWWRSVDVLSQIRRLIHQASFMALDSVNSLNYTVAFSNDIRSSSIRSISVLWSVFSF